MDFYRWSKRSIAQGPSFRALRNSHGRGHDVTVTYCNTGNRDSLSENEFES